MREKLLEAISQAMEWYGNTDVVIENISFFLNR